MKPEKGVDDMDEGVRDPKEVFIESGFLITEARTPNFSVKGRVEGPHCPPVVTGGPEHICDKFDEECLKAEQLKKHMSHLCRNGVPMRIDVIISPACKHGQMESSIVEGANFTTEDDMLLLERWDIQILSKRANDKVDGHVTARFLLQAIRSYLHFSQLSSWLISTSGQLPLQIICRAYVPGESVSLTFESPPEVHTFSHADMLHSSIAVSVASLKRRTTIPTLLCKADDALITPDSPKWMKRKSVEKKIGKFHKNQKSETTAREKSPVVEGASFDGAPCSSSRHHDISVDVISRQTLPQKPPTGRISAQEVNLLDNPNSQSCASKREFRGNESGDHYSSPIKKPFPQMAIRPPPITRDRFKDNPLILPTSDCGYEGISRGKYGQINKRLPSPKVLFTSKPEQPVYKRKRLNLDSPTKQESEWGSSFIDSDLKDFIKPLTSDDLETYLASLSHKLPEKSCLTGSQLDDIPSTTCKFYIGDAPVNLTGCESQVKSKEKTMYSPKRDQLPVKCLFKKSLSKDDNEELLSVEDEISGSLLKRESLTPKSLSDRKHISDSAQKQSTALSNKFEPDDCHIVRPSTTKKEKTQTDNDVHNGDSISMVMDSVKQRLENLQLDTESQNNFHLSDQSNHEISNTAENVSCQQREKTTGSLPKPATDSSLCKLVLKKELHHDIQSNDTASPLTSSQNAPSAQQVHKFRQHLGRSVSMMFNATTALPTQSSPAPIKRKSSGRFDYDSTLTNTRAIKNAISCSKLVSRSDAVFDDDVQEQKTLSTSAPASTNCLLGNFEESILNGRIEPVGVVEGFIAEIGAGGKFCPKHIVLPVTAYFFQLSDDNAPSPYLGHLNLESLGKKGYRIPRCGTVQVTLFNPNKSVVKMFVVMYDLNDMPVNSQTFLRQRTLYMPVDSNTSQPSYLRYLIHLRFASSRSGKIHLHTDIRLIFARDKFEFDSKTSNYELRSFTEGPQNPKFSPKR
ncbi:hypothetical protein ScPMuIL_002440 [Solemya velum]